MLVATGVALVSSVFVILFLLALFVCLLTVLIILLFILYTVRLKIIICCAVLEADVPSCVVKSLTQSCKTRKIKSQEQPKTGISRIHKSC